MPANQLCAESALLLTDLRKEKLKTSKRNRNGKQASQFSEKASCPN